MIEFDEVIQLAGYVGSPARVWCTACASYTVMVAPQQAALLTGLSVRTINRSVESHLVHFTETDEGLLLLCVNSLRPIDASP